MCLEQNKIVYQGGVLAVRVCAHVCVCVCVCVHAGVRMAVFVCARRSYARVYLYVFTQNPRGAYLTLKTQETLHVTNLESMQIR